MSEMKRIREAVRQRWSEQGECASCGWHAALYEYGEIEADDIDRDRGTIDFPCLNKYADDSSRHRGSRIYVGDALEAAGIPRDEETT